ncbi:hypothetical protein X975_13584, partial [Stegodyphus mimosarum]
MRPCLPPLESLFTMLLMMLQQTGNIFPVIHGKDP